MVNPLVLELGLTFICSARFAATIAFGCPSVSLPKRTVRLHSAIGFVTPADMLAGRQKEIHDARDGKLEEARRQRQLRRQQAA